jgi:hypothetical protein
MNKLAILYITCISVTSCVNFDEHLTRLITMNIITFEQA